MSAGQSRTPAPEATAAGHSLRHIPELDGIRGFAALAVFGHHAFATTLRDYLRGPQPLSVQHLSHVFEFANTGVDLFFVLSGFLITSILLGERRSPRYYQDFYWKRALRILPLYIVTITIAWFWFHQTAQTLMAMAFVVNFAGLLKLHLIEAGPFWSLGIEEQFYILWPTIVRRLEVRTVLRWSIALGLGSILLRILFGFGDHHDYQYTFLRCDGLAFGAALACHFFIAGSNTQRRRRIDGLLWTLLAAGIALIAVRNHLGHLYNPAFQTGVVLISGPIIGLSISHSGSRLLAPLRSRVLTFFGLISYAFYMVHVYVILLVEKIVGPFAATNLRTYWAVILASFIASVALSVLSRYALELPIMRLRKYVLRHPNRRAEEATPPLPLAQM